MADKTFWGIHIDSAAGQQLLLKHGVVAIGWEKLGDLSAIGGDRELIKKALGVSYPDAKPGAIPVSAGQLYRFVNELAVGDIVVFRSREQPAIHMGQVTGPYRYDVSEDSGHPNRRPVKWVREVKITAVSQGALYELGAAMSFFQLKNYAEEWTALLAGSTPTTALAETDDTVATVSAATEQSTRDFVRKRLSKELKGHPFTHFVAHLLETMGYRTRVSPEGSDGGIDIVAHRDELGFEPPIVKVQVKSGDGSVGGPAISELLGNLTGSGEFGLFVALGTFSMQARQKAKTTIRLIDGEALVDLILAHYEELDSRYKSLIPLKRMYIPQPLPES